jgi:hypothetical protein
MLPSSFTQLSHCFVREVVQIETGDDSPKLGGVLSAKSKDR